MAINERKSFSREKFVMQNSSTATPFQNGEMKKRSQNVST